DQTAAANGLRATLSQATSSTAPDDTAQDAWDAAAQLDLATTRDAAAITAVATRLLQRADTLVQQIPDTVSSALMDALRALVADPSIAPALAAAELLGQVATLRDQQARKRDLPSGGELVGPRRTIVTTFVEAAMDQVD